MKNVNKAEVDFIENYHKFFSLKDKNFTNFIVACNSLITIGQISRESLEYFIEKNDSDKVIDEKTKEYNELVSKSEKLLKEIQSIKDKFVIKPKREIDPCGHGGGSGTRSSC